MIPVRRETHSGLGWRPAVGFGFARTEPTVAISTVEIPRVAQALPIAFRKHQDQWQAVAVMGASDGVNFYVSAEGRWRAGFVPALLRVYPFCLDAQGSLSVRDGFRPENPEHKGVEPFFENGTLTKRLSETRHFLRAVTDGVSAAGPVLERLDAAGALVPWHVPGIDGPELDRAHNGFFVLDSLRLGVLDDEAVLAHFRSGALRWLYAHLDSLHHDVRLQALARGLAENDFDVRLRPEKIDDAADVLAAIVEDLGDAEP